MDTKGQNNIMAKDSENATTFVEADRYYMRTITTVFWDVDDFPSPEGYKIRTIVKNMKTALANEDYRDYGNQIVVKSYVDRKNVTERMLHEWMHEAPEILGMQDPGHKRGRLDNMVLDIGFWVMRNPPIPGKSITNLMIISKNMPEDTMLVSLLQGLKVRGYNIQLVEHRNCAESDQLPLDLASHVWHWESLVDGGDPFYWADYVKTDSEEEEGASNFGCANYVEAGSGEPFDYANYVDPDSGEPFDYANYVDPDSGVYPDSWEIVDSANYYVHQYSVCR